MGCIATHLAPPPSPHRNGPGLALARYYSDRGSMSLGVGSYNVRRPVGPHRKDHVAMDTCESGAVAVVSPSGLNRQERPGESQRYPWQEEMSFRSGFEEPCATYSIPISKIPVAKGTSVLLSCTWGASCRIVVPIRPGRTGPNPTRLWTRP